jgi:transcriptional regulator with XRE-family HTH domain
MPEPVDVERLGQRLRRARKDQQATLEDVSKATGVSVATLSRVERGGSKDIDAGTLVSVCE